MLERSDAVDRCVHHLRTVPVVAILGARQVGKTTLARQIAEAWPELGLGLGPARRPGSVPSAVTMFDLEDERDVARLQDPYAALEGLRGLVVLDEIQRRPELFPALRVLVDQPDAHRRFLVLGSASPELLRQGSETLAGRIAFEELGGFDLAEVGASEYPRLWVRGGFPRSFLAADEAASLEWRRQFIRTFVERDLPQLGVGIPAATTRSFWSMLAHYHGRLWNGAELARAFGVSESTVRRYLGHLAATFAVRTLPAWRENLKKRQVRAPKVYVADSGLLHALLDVRDQHDLLGHPCIGASWEGFAIEAVRRHLAAATADCHHWRTHGGAELDLLVVRGRRRQGFEMKRTSAPRRTRAMGVAMSSLRLDSLDVIYPGDDTFPLGEGIRAVGITRVAQDVER